MKDLYLSPTTKTPGIEFKANGEFRIAGNSYPENATEFYQPVINWLDKFLRTNTNGISLNVDLKYINTSSIKSILKAIIKIRTLSKSTVKVAWLYEIEDEDMLEAGEDLQKLSKLEFEFIEKEED